MQQESMSLVEFQRRFGSDEACMEHLFKLRWPEGYHCRRCGHGSYCLHSTRRLYQCSNCKYQVSITAGTIFDKTRVPLTKWFLATFVMTTVQKDIPMRGLGPILGISNYKTLWAMGHRIRKAVADRHEESELRCLSKFDNALLACLSSSPATFADLKA